MRRTYIPPVSRRSAAFCGMSHIPRDVTGPPRRTPTPPRTGPVLQAPLSARSVSPQGLLAPSSPSLTAIVSVAIPGPLEALVGLMRSRPRRSPRPPDPARKTATKSDPLPACPRSARQTAGCAGSRYRPRWTLGQVRAATAAVTSEGAPQVAGCRAPADAVQNHRLHTQRPVAAGLRRGRAERPLTPNPGRRYVAVAITLRVAPIRRKGSSEAAMARVGPKPLASGSNPGAPVSADPLCRRGIPASGPGPSVHRRLQIEGSAPARPDPADPGSGADPPAAGPADGRSGPLSRRRRASAQG